MNKILLVAKRELLSTLATKGFIFGILLTPAIMGLVIIVFPLLISDDAPKVEGVLALQDLSGEVGAGVATFLSPAEIAKRREKETAEVMEEIPEGLQAIAATGGGEAQEALEDAFGEIPDISIKTLPSISDVEAEKTGLTVGVQGDGGLLALAVIHANAVDRGDAESYGTYDLYVRSKLDDRIEDEIAAALRSSIIEARIRVAGFDEEEIRGLTRIGRVRSITVTEEGEQETNEVLNILIPAGFMVLLLMSVLTSGQNMMTNTIEEKSSRVVEVLLSAVSPMELMTGKILGQMGVGFIVLALYSALGGIALASFAALGFIDPVLIVYLVLFYLVAYPCLAALMGSIGAAVNDIKEAQALMTPVMLIVMIPWILWMPISRDPNSVLAIVMSYIPPLSSFVMLLRMSSTAPPPTWQVWLSLAVGAVGVYGALWFAAKVFRIGLLMHGKPPNLKTLIRWARMA